jgi:hypothetical protein
MRHLNIKLKKIIIILLYILLIYIGFIGFNWLELYFEYMNLCPSDFMVGIMPFAIIPLFVAYYSIWTNRSLAIGLVVVSFFFFLILFYTTGSVNSVIRDCRMQTIWWTGLYIMIILSISIVASELSEVIKKK